MRKFCQIVSVKGFSWENQIKLDPYLIPDGWLLKKSLILLTRLILFMTFLNPWWCQWQMKQCLYLMYLPYLELLNLSHLQLTYVYNHSFWLPTHPINKVNKNEVIYLTSRHIDNHPLTLSFLCCFWMTPYILGFCLDFIWILSGFHLDFVLTSLEL